MEHPAERNTVPVIAGVFGMIALALSVIGALAYVDHINLAGTNRAASVQQQEQKSTATNPTAPSSVNQPEQASPSTPATPNAAPPKAN